MEKIIIIGAGPAGISAALYAARANMNPLVINNGIGALEKAEKIENYYGMEHPVSGKELFETGLAQAKALGVRILEVQVLGIGGFDTFTVKTTAGDFDTISVILATGSKRKAPAIPGIKEFEGRGVSYCAVCDAFFYRGKDVAVLGNSDFALHEAEELAPMAGSVTIYTDGKEPEFSRKSSFAVNTMKIQSVEGDEKVSGLRLISQSETDFILMLIVSTVYQVLYSVAGEEVVQQMQQKFPMYSMKMFGNIGDSRQFYVDICTTARLMIADQRKKSSVMLCNRAIRIINEKFADPDLSLVSVSTEISVSPNYLSALLKKDTGETFKELLTKKRIETAKELLMDTNMKVREISEKCGYNDQHYFSYCFKKYTGVSPNSCRRTYEDGRQD